jgi:hypothetical protein
MKLDPNMEIDRLLQRTARRGAASSLSFSARHEDGGSDGREPQHMDADELSAYAENALPAAARARYMSHLADCDACRKQVTELVLSLGIASELERQSAPQPLTALPSSSATPARTWRMRLSALFAPAALRYAATVVVLVGVVAVAFMVFRGGRQMKFDEPDTASTNAPANRNSQPANQNQDFDSNSSGGTPLPSQTPAGTFAEPLAKDTQTNREGQTASPVIAPADAPKTDNAPATATTAGPSSNNFNLDGVDSAEREAGRDEDASAVGGNKQQPAPAAQRAEKDKAQKEAKTLGATSGVADLSSAQGRRDADTKKAEEVVAETRVQQPPASESQTGARKRAANRPKAVANERMASGEASDDSLLRDERANTKEERRNVSGRQFIRRDGAWVDTAYRSQATTNVRRGSEQYRALVADEPGLRTITHELGGEVIIVWKGRAYRIR